MYFAKSILLTKCILNDFVKIMQITKCILNNFVWNGIIGKFLNSGISNIMKIGIAFCGKTAVVKKQVE